jgi:hypothetical protein
MTIFFSKSGSTTDMSLEEAVLAIAECRRNGELDWEIDSEGISITPVAPEDEGAYWVVSHWPHVACLVRKDGVIEMRIAPDEDSAGKALYEMLVENRKKGRGFKRAYVKLATT